MANCLPLFGFVCLAREKCKNFKNKGGSIGEVWDLFYFYSSLWASCTNIFKGVPLSVLHLNWVAVCDSSL